MADAGEPVQVLHVLVAQDLDQRLRRHGAEQPARRGKHRHRGEPVAHRDRGDPFLVGLRPHAVGGRLQKLFQRRSRRGGEEMRHGDQAGELAFAVDREDGVDVIELPSSQVQQRGFGGELVIDARHALDHVLACGLDSVRVGCRHRFPLRVLAPGGTGRRA